MRNLFNFVSRNFLLIVGIILFFLYKNQIFGFLKSIFSKQKVSTNKFGTTGEGEISGDISNSPSVINSLAGGVDNSRHIGRVEKDKPLINLAVYTYTKLQGVTWSNEYTHNINRIANLSKSDMKFLLGVFWQKYNKDLRSYLKNEANWDIAYTFNFHNPFNPAIEAIDSYRKWAQTH